MFKESIICIVIIFAIFVGNFITQDYTKNTVEELTEELSSLRDKILQENSETLNKTLENVNNKWQEKHDKLAYYIEHNELEKIETEITSFKSNIENKEYKKSIEDIDKTMFLLKHVEDRYAFNLENIF